MLYNKCQAINKLGLSIYSEVKNTYPHLFLSTNELEDILRKSLVGISLEGLPLRTRSKVVKSLICKALGYDIPNSFKKTQPRFPGQNFDIYIQKSMNVQIWNEEIDLTRRYVFIKVNPDDIITNVKVILGTQLIQYDNTGTLTQKYQAKMISYSDSILFSSQDTNTLLPLLSHSDVFSIEDNPNDPPQKGKLLSIENIFKKLKRLVGEKIDYKGATQERNRGAEVHALICKLLGYKTYKDDGTYPDILNQLLEIKLQTSPTIDLGLHSPLDNDPIISNNTEICSRDIRYIVIDGKIEEDSIKIMSIYMSTGNDFFKHFQSFKGRGQNTKIQMPLPPDFFS